MLKHVSWALFLEAAGIALCCYYVVVGLLVFRNDLKRYFISGRQSPPKSAEAEADDPVADNASLASLEAVVHRINGILADAGTSATKEQILPPVKDCLAVFPGWRTPAYRVALINHIITKAKEICGVGITSHELE